MMIRYPLVRAGDEIMLTRETEAKLKAYWVPVYYEHVGRRAWYAPWWLAPLYRWLPWVVFWCNEPEHRVRQEGGWFLCGVNAPAGWTLAWMPLSRLVDGGNARLGHLHYGFWWDDLDEPHHPPIAVI